jgi:hypothetical protein
MTQELPEGAGGELGGRRGDAQDAYIVCTWRPRLSTTGPSRSDTVGKWWPKASPDG